MCNCEVFLISAFQYGVFQKVATVIKYFLFFVCITFAALARCLSRTRFKSVFRIADHVWSTSNGHVEIHTDGKVLPEVNFGTVASIPAIIRVIPWNRL